MSVRAATMLGMSIGKKLLAAVATGLLTLSLLGGASLLALQQTIGDEAYVKETLRSGNIYQQFFAKTAGSTNPENSTIDPQTRAQLTEAEVAGITKALQQALPPEFLQSTSEQIIDSVWQWSRSADTDVPTLSIDVSAQREQVITQLSQYYAARANDLPVCEAPITDVDPLTAECRPPLTFSAADFRPKITEMVDKFGFAKDGVITGDEVVPTAQNNQAPQGVPLLAYLQTGLWLSVAGGVLGAAGVLWACWPANRALRVLGWTFISAGAAVGLTALAVWAITEVLSGAKDEGNAQMLLDLVLPVFTGVGYDIAAWHGYAAIGYILAGVLLLLARSKVGQQPDHTVSYPTAPQAPPQQPSSIQ